MTRHITAVVAIGLLSGLLVFDLSTSRVNPYVAPPVVALGSGLASTGGFCGVMPK
ncbi:MAG: hypothetical protein QMB16_08480 [Paracoccaceae bacterium]